MLFKEATDKMLAVAEAAAERFRADGLIARVEIGYMNAFLATVTEPKKARFMTVSLVITTEHIEEGEEYYLSVGAEIRGGKVDDAQLEKDLAEFDGIVNETAERLSGYENKSVGVTVLAEEANAEYDKLVERLREDHKKQKVVSAIGIGLFIVGIIILFIVATFSA